MPSRSILTVADGRISFLFWPTGEGSGNPLQCSCLENPRDGSLVAYGVVQSRTRLMSLSSSSPFCVYVCVYHIFFIHSWADGHFGCFPILAVINNTAVNMDTADVSLKPCFHFLQRNTPTWNCWIIW